MGILVYSVLCMGSAGFVSSTASPVLEQVGLFGAKSLNPKPDI